jgi:hypothetical protein
LQEYLAAASTAQGVALPTAQSGQERLRSIVHAVIQGHAAAAQAEKLAKEALQQVASPGLFLLQIPVNVMHMYAISPAQSGG